MSKLDQRTFSLGAKPEIVIADRYGISIVSGGTASRISLRADETSTKIVHETEKGDVILSEGGAVEMASLYGQLTSSLSGRSEGAFSRKGVIAAAFILGSILGLAANGSGRDQGNPDLPPEAMVGQSATKDSGPELSRMFEEMMKRRSIAGAGMPLPNGQVPPLGDGAKPDAQSAPPVGMPPGLSGFNKGTAILPAPDFIKVPDTLPPIPEIAPTTSAAEAPADTGSNPPSPDSPPRNPKASVTDDRNVRPDKAASTSLAGAALASKLAEDKIAQATALLDSSMKEALAASSPSRQADASAFTPAKDPIPEAKDPPKDILPAPAADKAGGAPVPDAPKENKPAGEPGPQAGSDGPKTGAATQAASAKSPEIGVDQAAIKGVIDGMVRSGMSPEDRMKLLTQIEQLSGSGQITPQMLRELPHEVARILVDSGVVDEADLDAPDGIPYRIIRLPEKVMERYRGKDGIASIPERDSWVSTGNSVKLPLPGGGDVKTADDIKAFGLIP